MLFPRFTLLAALCVCIASQARADLTQNMIARWTFNQSDNTSLVDSVSKIKLVEKGTGGDQTTTFNPDGSVTLGRGRTFISADINSEKYPQLAKNVTIWARIKIDEPSALTFILGLLNADNPADWKEQTLAISYNPQAKPEATLGGFGWLNNKVELTTGSESKPVKTGEFKNIAIAWDGDAKTMTFFMDGLVVVRRYSRGDATLQAFKSFALGRLKQSATAKVTLDEVRIYDVALTAEWIGEIEAAK